MNKETFSILIADDEPLILQLLEIMISSELEVEITTANNGEEAIQFLKEREFSLILSDYRMPKVSGDGVYLFNKGYKNLPFILFSGGDVKEYPGMEDFFESNPKNHNLIKPADDEVIISAIKNILHDIESDEDIIDQFRLEKGLKKVKPYFLTKLSKSNFNLFMKLGDGKFLQVASKENKDMKSVIDHYLTKENQLPYFYLSTNDYEAFIKEAESTLQSFKEESKEGPNKTEVTFTALDFAFSVAQDHLEALGITKVHEEFINSSLDRICSDLKSDKEIFGTLKEMLKNDDYLSEHSILNIYFSSYLLTKLNWATDQTLKQMIFASFYHDIEISDQELAKVKFISEIKDSKVQKLVKEHGQRAAKLLDKLPGMNSDAHKIILDHHERPDGKGFPLGLSATNIPPLSCVFILSHEIVDFLIENQFKTQSLATKIQEMESTWDTGNFKRIFNCMRSILLD